LQTERITEYLYEIKSLLSLYRNYAKYTQNEDKLGNAKKEMKLVKEKILKQVIDLKKLVKKLESEVIPRGGVERGV